MLAANTQDSKIIDGKLISSLVRDEIKQEVFNLKPRIGRAPGLAVILVGDNPASRTYVSNKGKAARDCGFETFDTHLPSTVTQEEVLAVINGYNNDKRVDGILLQLPVPKHLKSDELISAIDVAKDADGLHPINQGLLMQGRCELKPCTPSGVIELLKRSNVEIAGKSAVVIGRSILVGKPASFLLLDENATVTIAHSKTKNLKEVVLASDIVVAAVGIPEFVKGDWIKQGAVVIDVGINRTPDGKLCGDVDYKAAFDRASMITPVPGGVGPMTIAMLLKNTLTSFKTRENV